MRNPYIDIITQYEKDYLKHFSELGFKIASEFFEKTIIWIIGLSTGTIVLIFTQLGKNSETSFLPNHAALKWTAIILVSCIVSGIIGRVLYAIALYRGYAFISQFYLKVSELALPKSPRQLNGNETSEFIYLLFQEEFNVDLPIIIENKKTASALNKDLEDQAARKLYNDYLELITSKVNEGTGSVAVLKNTVYNIPSPNTKKVNWFRKLFNKIIQPNAALRGKVWRTFTWLSFRLYILSALFFILAIIYFVSKLYC